MTRETDADLSQQYVTSFQFSLLALFRVDSTFTTTFQLHTRTRSNIVNTRCRSDRGRYEQRGLLSASCFSIPPWIVSYHESRLYWLHSTYFVVLFVVCLGLHFLNLHFDNNSNNVNEAKTLKQTENIPNGGQMNYIGPPLSPVGCFVLPELIKRYNITSSPEDLRPLKLCKKKKREKKKLETLQQMQPCDLSPTQPQTHLHSSAHTHRHTHTGDTQDVWSPKRSSQGPSLKAVAAATD